MELASQAIKMGLSVIDEKRKKSSLIQHVKELVKIQNYDSLTTGKLNYLSSRLDK